MGTLSIKTFKYPVPWRWQMKSRNEPGRICPGYLSKLGAKGVGRPRGYAPCWQGYTSKTRVKPNIPAKSYTCMSMSWLLGNV
jgi:hypothetical protein